MSREQLEAVGAKARNLGKVTGIEAEVPVAVAAAAKLKQDGCPDGAILVRYASVKEAMEAVWQLHRCKIKSGGKSATLWARQVNGEGANVRPHGPVLQLQALNTPSELITSAAEWCV